MKKFILSICLLSVVSLADAQIAKWLIEPGYDSIRMADGLHAIITDSLTFKSLWTYEGKKLMTTSNDMYSFRENRSVALAPQSDNIVEIIKANGEIIPVDGCRVAHSFPYFSCGKLLVQEGVFYRYIGNEGQKEGMLYTKAFPYFNNYATCQTFMNMEKQKDLYCLLIDGNEDVVQFSYNGKVFRQDDVEFISSVNDENIAIVVIKHKVYRFNGADATLSPVFASAYETNLKNQAKIDGDISQCLKRLSNGLYLLVAKCGKSTSIAFYFDMMLRPESVSLNGQTHKYAVRTERREELSSSLAIERTGGLYGLSCDGEEMLPPQFENITECFGNKAFVKLKGKYGMCEIEKDDKFALKVNKGNDVAFLHQKFETTVRVDMPSYILSDKTYLNVYSDCGIELDKTSREKRNTESGNFIEYNCVLNIPGNLLDEIEEVNYPLQILYNGLKSPVINHKINAWFYKKYEVEEDESQRNIEQGTLTFVFNIKNSQLDGAIVKFDVSVMAADTLLVEREDKLSETRYKYKVYDLSEGINNIVVQILEQGCPPAYFPFEVEYHKPVEKTRTKPAAGETVTIKKKPKEQKKTTSNSTPRLEI